MPSFFNNKIQFIALRDLSGDYKQKLDQWVVKDKLGDPVGFLSAGFQDNLKEVVAEIKRRNLYLFDLLGDIFRFWSWWVLDPVRYPGRRTRSFRERTGRPLAGHG